LSLDSRPLEPMEESGQQIKKLEPDNQTGPTTISIS